MASTNDEVFMSSRCARDTATSLFSTCSVLRIAAAEAIAVAVGDGLLTATVDTTGATSRDVQYVMELLRSLGYTVSLSVLNMVIVW